MPFSTENLLRDLCRLPHRGASTRYETPAVELLSKTLTGLRAEVETQSFPTPKTYVSLIYWLTGGLSLGLLAFGWWPVPALLWTGIWVVFSWLYYNGRYSPVIHFPPLVTSRNVIGRWKPFQGPWEGRPEAPALKVILMAHYDTAPISLFYQTNRVRRYHWVLLLNFSLMVCTIGLMILEYAGFASSGLPLIRYGLVAYFLFFGLLATIGYWLYGYSNGASDNATGVAAALATAGNLRSLGLPGLELEVVLTGAREVGMVGSLAYIEKYRRTWPEGRTAVINFDTLGNGALRIIKHTGTVEVMEYSSELMAHAESLLEEIPFRKQVLPARRPTADLDSTWFVRKKIPVMTLTALDENGRMPHVHQPEDKLVLTDLSAVPLAVDFAVRCLLKQYQAYEVAAERL
ncbi:M28 family metallopeptidase [Larkinella soli]|uniref:M28 family metallopeptidase n=1 Tax=Larkinella soli TaxID=1770527 RepID=UPI000FFB9C6C|nr:M28 family peptidase [Larkinella soli]